MSRQGKLQAPADVVLSGLVATDEATINARGILGCRVIMRGTGGANGSFQVYGCDTNSADPLDWYPLGPAVAFAADGSQTLWVGEPNSWLKVALDSYVAGSFDASVQRYS